LPLILRVGCCAECLFDDAPGRFVDVRFAVVLKVCSGEEAFVAGFQLDIVDGDTPCFLAAAAKLVLAASDSIVSRCFCV